MKKSISMFLSLAISLALVACSGSSGSSAPSGSSGAPSAPETSVTSDAPHKLVFGVSMPQLDNDGFKANLVGIKQFAEANQIDLVVTDAKSSAESQMQQIEDLITKDVDAIVMCPVDSGALAAAVRKAQEANIPVVSFDRNVADNVLTGLAESDNVAHGSAAADLMKESAEKNGLKIEDLVVLELLGTQSATAGLERHQGFTSRADELGIKISASLPTEFKNDNAYNAVLDAFQANPKINAIFIASDNAMYSGVESALLQLDKLVPAGDAGHILITTVDGGPQGLEGIRKGYIDAIAAQSKLLMSEEAMKLAMDAANKNPISEPVIRIQPTPVTKDNVDDKSLWANSVK